MPLVTSAVLVYCAGLLAGFGNALVWTLGAGALVVWQGARTSRDRVALTTLGVAAFLTAASSRANERACGSRLLTERSWTVTLDVMPIMGDVKDKRIPPVAPPPLGPPPPNLLLRGSVVMGEVKVTD